MYNAFHSVPNKGMFKKVSISIIAILFILIFAFGMFLWVLPSGKEYSKKILSPDGEYAVRVVELNGGATTPYDSAVTIVNEKSFFNNFGILSIWMNTKTAVFGYEGVQSSVKVLWVNNRTLKITHTDCTGIDTQKYTWKDIKIIYEKKCTSGSL